MRGLVENRAPLARGRPGAVRRVPLEARLALELDRAPAVVEFDWREGAAALEVGWPEHWGPGGEAPG